VTSNILDFNTAPRASELRAMAAVDQEVRLERLRGALTSRATDLVREIFPRAIIARGEARIGSTDGEAGESLAIALQGDRAGLWTDHATGEGGDLIDLWRATQGLTGPTGFSQAVDDLEGWVGLKPSPAPAWLNPVHKVAKARAEAAAKEPAPTPSTLGPPVATWHYYSADGAILGKVSKYLLANGEKTYRPFNAAGKMQPPDPRPLYRIPEIRTANTVILTEGEKCADALASLGFEATSAMGGANALIEKTDWAPLAGKTVLLWPDNDAPGREFMARVKPALEAIGCSVSIIDIGHGRPEKWDAADAVDAGEDIAAIIGTVSPKEAPARRYKLLSIEDMEDLEPLDWLIDGALPTSGFIGLYGPSGGLKSFIAVDIGLHIAAGLNWHGRDVKPGPVVYVAGEGKRGLAKRVLGWRSAKAGAARPDFHLLPSSVSISVTDDLSELIATITDLPVRPVLIVLDTLARNFGPGDENSQKDMGAFVRGVDRLIEETGAAVLVVHHTGKDDAKGERGSSALRGALDTSIFVKRRDRAVELVNRAPHGKQKDADEFEDIKLYASPVSFEHRGEAEKTLVLTLDTSPVREGGDEDDEDQPEPAQRLGPIETKILTALGQAATAGQGLRFMRLKMMIGGDHHDSAIDKAIRRLVEKGRITKSGEGYLLP